MDTLDHNLHSHNSVLMQSLMTQGESEALKLHNMIFTKPAIRLISTGGWRFYVEYADGSTKWDYGCGSASRQLGEIAGK